MLCSAYIVHSVGLSDVTECCQSTPVMALPANGLTTRATGVVSLCFPVYGGLLYMYIPCVHTFYMYIHVPPGGWVGGCGRESSSRCVRGI